MENALPVTERETLVALARKIVRHVYRLANQEIMLAKEELAEEWTKIKKVVLYLFITGILVLVAMITFAMALAHWLESVTSLPSWACEGIITVVFVAVGLFFFEIARFRIRALDLVPRKALESIKENMQCLNKKI